ncbi:MAG: MFS transporter [Breznakibacter sp.]|nr:MFS transporter [Breznakibacter sp.]
MLTMPILMLFYKDVGFTTTQSFQLKAFYSISIVIFDLPSGYLADIIGRKRSILIGAVLGTLGFFIYSTTTGFYAFLLAEIALGIGQSFINGADGALLYDSLRESKRESDYLKYEGRMFSVGNFSEAAGSFCGGILAFYSLRLPFFFQTGVAFMAIPAALLLYEPLRQESTRKSFIEVLVTMKDALVNNIPLRWNMLFSALIGSATLTMAWIYQLRLKSVGFDEVAIGATAMVLNVMAGIVTAFAYRVEAQLKPKVTLLATTVVITLSFILASFTTGYLLLIVFALFYSARGVINPVLKEYVNRVIGSDVRASILSLRSVSIRLLFAVIGPFFGWYTDFYSLEEAMAILGIMFTITTLFSIYVFFKASSSKKNIINLN